MDGDRSSTKVDAVPEGDEDAAREAAESCPVEAIEID
jgi:ferredoxin